MKWLKRLFSKEPTYTVEVQDESIAMGEPAWMWSVTQHLPLWDEPIALGVTDTFAEALKAAHDALAGYRKELNKDVYREQVR